MPEQVRERTIQWDDPSTTASAFAEHSGFEISRGIADGTFPAPPMAVLLDLGVSQIGDGVVTFTMQTAEYMSNPLGFVHGGAMATLLDTVLTVCVFTKLPAGKSCTTTDLQLQFVRPLVASPGELVAEGRVVFLGKTRATAAAHAMDAGGTIYAHATAGLAILDVAALTRR